MEQKRFNFWQGHSLRYLEMAFRTDRREIVKHPDGITRGFNRGYGEHSYSIGFSSGRFKPKLESPKGVLKCQFMNTAAMIVAPHPNFYADLAVAKKSFVTIAAASTCKESCRLHRLSTLVINGLPAIPAAVVKNVAKYPLALKAVAAAGVKRSCYYRKDRKEWDKPTKPGRSYEQQFKAVTTE